MANKKISGYTEKTALDTTDLFLIEQAAGTYRKVSSSTLTQVITSSVTYTIGSGGDFADFVTAMAYLKNKWIPHNVTVTLQLCSNLVLSTQASYTFGAYRAAVYMNHPCSIQIRINTNGWNITVGDGTTDVNGFVVANSSALILSDPGVDTGSLIAAKNGTACGIYVYPGGYFNGPSGHRLIVGASGYGFGYACYCGLGAIAEMGYMDIRSSAYYGVYCDGGRMDATQITIADNASGGFFATRSGFVFRSGCTGDQATSANPTIGTVSSDGSRIM